MDLLLLSDGRTHHYVLISNLMSVICKVRGRTYRDRNILCRNCFHVCSSLNSMRVHQQICMEHDPAVIRMPTEKVVKFKNVPAESLLPYVIYFDMESLIVPVQTVRNKDSVSSTTIIEKHLPCSFCAVVVEKGNPKPSVVKLERGPEVMQSFLEFVEGMARNLYEKKRQHTLYTGPPRPAKEFASECWICHEHFADNNTKVLDHCHWSGVSLLGS